MNYYPFHIGDYAAHTAHLSWEEDIAYRRMLDAYYLQENPLPADLPKLARLIRMPRSKKAIDAVLSEFFTLEADGCFHNARADQELASMAEKHAQQAAKDAHETERMRRYRERRAQLFDALRERGIVPAWDIPMKELQRLCDEHGNAPATHLQREQVANSTVACNADATAIPIPTPIPIPKEVEKKGTRAPAAALAPACPPDVPEQVWSDWTALRKAKRAPVTQTVLDGARAEATKAGIPLAVFLGIWCTRGSQGLQADWIKPEEVRAVRSAEPAWRADQRRRMQQAVPGIAERTPHDPLTIDVEARDATPPALD